MSAVSYDQIVQVIDELEKTAAGCADTEEHAAEIGSNAMVGAAVYGSGFLAHTRPGETAHEAAVNVITNALPGYHYGHVLASMFGAHLADGKTADEALRSMLDEYSLSKINTFFEIDDSGYDLLTLARFIVSKLDD